MTIVVQLNAGILLGVMGTDVHLTDLMDIIPEYKVTYYYLYTCL